MTDMYGDDDPIAALTCLNEATETYRQACKDADAAITRREDAKRILNAYQDSFDALVERLHKHAPFGTTWDNRY